jgi:hypothetical protein
MAQIPAAKVVFLADNSNLVTGVDQVKSKLEGLNGAKGVSGISSSLDSLKTAFIGLGVAAGVGLGLLAYKIKGAISNLAELAKNARDAGVSSKALNQLNKVAVRFGVSSATIGDALQSLHDKFPGEDAIAALEAVRAKFQELPPGAEAAAYAQEMFGSSAEAMYPLLTANNEEWEKYIELTKKFEIPDMGAEKAEQAQEAMGRLGMAWNDATETLYSQLAVKCVPMIEWLAELFEDFASDTSIGMEIVNTAWDYFTAGLEHAANIAQILTGAFQVLFGGLQIGIGVIIHGLKYLVQGIEWVLEQVFGLHSELSKIFDEMGDAMVNAGLTNSGKGFDNLFGDKKWWGDSVKEFQKQLKEKPIEVKRSFQDEDIPESLQRERDLQAGALGAKLPEALEKGSKDALSLMAKFQNGQLVDRNKELDVANKQLKAQEDIKKELKKNKPKIAKF